MSESIAQPYQECDEITGQSMYPIQSAWVARWIGTGQNVTSQACHTPNPFESKKSDDATSLHDPAAEPGNASNINLSAGELRNFGTQTHEVVNESLRKFSGNIRVESSTHHSTTMSTPGRNGLSLKDGQETHGCLAFKHLHDLKTTSGTANADAKERGLHSMLHGTPTATANSSGKHYSEHEASLQNPIRQVKPHSFFRHNHAVASVPSVGNCMESAPHIVPYRFGYRKFKDDASQTETPLLMDSASKTHLPNGSLRMLEDKHKYESHLENENSMDLPSSSNGHPQKFHGDWFHKLQNGSRLAVFRNNCPSLEVTEPKKVLNNICMPQELPHSLHDVKTMRICTTVGLTGCYPRFSQTTHSLLIMNEADVNICKQNQTLGTSGNEFNSQRFNNLDNLPPVVNQKQQGVKLQLLDSSTASEFEENNGDVEPSEVDAKNESSAETDTMDIDAFPGKTDLLGVNSCSADDNIKNRLPNINSQPPNIPAEASSADNLELSSNTQSLDMESLIAHSEEHSNPKPNLFQFNLPGPEANSRFVKRLKLSNLYNIALGTRSSNSKEDSAYEKRKNNSTQGGGITCSEPISSKPQVKDNKHTTRNGKSSSTDKLTSYSWIQRLLCDKSTNALKKAEAAVYEPGSSDLEPEQIQKRQFPSIAAMALMGKGMKGFQPCQFQKKGSSIVWNTNGSSNP